MKKLYLFVIICLLVITPSLAQDITIPDDFEIQGHRGARGLKPENTLPAFEIALDLMVDTLEMDMHYTADNEVVIWHDSAIDLDLCRLPEGVDLDLPENDSLIYGSNPRDIRKLTLEQVQTFICDMNPNRQQFPEQDNEPTTLAGDNYHIATLREVFEFVGLYAESDEKTEAQRENATNVKFNLESKRQVNRPSAIDDDFDGENIGEFELAILEIITEFDLIDRVTIQSFDHRVIWAVNAENPDITIAALTRQGRGQLEQYAEDGAEIWSPNFAVLDEDNVTEAHELGLRVIPWTVNNPDDMLALIELGVDGIITDRPDILINF